MARSERGLKEGGENLGRKVRKRAPQATRRWFEVGEKANVGTGSGGEEGRRTKGGGPAADGPEADERVFSRKNTSSSISRARGILCVFKLS